MILEFISWLYNTWRRVLRTFLPLLEGVPQVWLIDGFGVMWFEYFYLICDLIWFDFVAFRSLLWVLTNLVHMSLTYAILLLQSICFWRALPHLARRGGWLLLLAASLDLDVPLSDWDLASFPHVARYCFCYKQKQSGPTSYRLEVHHEFNEFQI